MKLKKIEIKDNEKIGSVELDFTKNGVVQDTIIFAGNNGCGKTTILEEIMLLAENGRASHLERTTGYICAKIILTNEELEKIKENIKNAKHGNINEIEKIKNEIELLIDFTGEKGTYGRLKVYSISAGKKEKLDSYNVLYHGKLEHIISSFYSAANIDYVFNDIGSITTIDIDVTEFNSIRSSNDTGNQIKQTFIDIYNLDAQDFLEWANNNKGKSIDENMMYLRLKRFKNAFSYIMDDLEFDQIINTPGKKQVMFKRNGKNINIDDLSTGEKQIIIRGGFLLRFLKVLNGSFILIDEPELSLHPEWQNKILQFYKKLFTNEKGEQVSQIFVATHSPFIINNSSRYNDKVIVLQRNKNSGEIEVIDKPTYYDCSNSVYIQEAFDLSEFDKDSNVLFTEGETDEKYLEKAIEIFFNNKIDFKVEWIGKKNKTGNVINSGCTGLNNMLKVLEANENLFSKKVGLLYDNDTNKPQINEKKYFTYTLHGNKNKVYKIGIENALNLPCNFDYSKYEKTIEKEDDYGMKSIYKELDKTKLCEDICNSDNVKEYLIGFKNIIKDIKDLMNNK